MRIIRGPYERVDISGSAATALAELERRATVLGTDNQAVAQTNKLLCQPTAGTRFVLTGLLLSTDTAMNIRFIAAGSDIVPPVYLPANGSGNIIFPTPLQLGVNHGIQYTSSAVGNHSVAAYGWEE